MYLIKACGRNIRVVEGDAWTEEHKRRVFLTISMPHLHLKDKVYLMVLRYLSCILLLLCLTRQIDAEVFDKPIDIVYLWVDGNDPAWQKIKKECASIVRGEGAPPDANANNRYSDHNELKYSLRSVWKYASFVNHIFIVTMDQKPAWLAEHPQITIIDHKVIFKNQEDLPTFNSMAIESNLHRIPQLSEHFIYFNDDMFLGKEVAPSDFFTNTGKVKVLLEKHLSPDGPANKKDITYWAACRNTNNLLNQKIKRETRLLISHSPYALLKSYMEKTAQQFPEAFESTSKHKFRCFEDYTITNGLLQQHWNYLGKTRKGKLTNMMVYIFDDERIKETVKSLKIVEAIRPHTYCLQDKIFGCHEKTSEALNNFFESWYPEHAPWEKDL